MKMNPLGQSGLMVSELCLGTMTYGNQTALEDAHEQIELAFDAGINFMDTAEMYPVNPVRAETVGLTEEVIGKWFAKTGRRKDWILATKHSGAGSLARDGEPISGETIGRTIEASLRRLQTDHIDLYQFHWPNRGSYAFRKNWAYNPSSQDRQRTMDHMADCLKALQEQVDKGNIGHFGLSNESAWGTTMWLRVAEQMGGPRVQSVQNEYSLMCRLADIDLAEVLCNENVGLLPYSPLAAGLLTGKYQNGQVPEGSRMAGTGDLGGRRTDRAFETVAAYQAVADKFGLDLVQMSIAFSVQRPFVASSIFGATTTPQLKRILDGAGMRLSDEVMDALNEVHKAHPMPY
ncbi:aldo/keto reductase [Pseudoprimorskyibacter insulae]|uniref:General stress protein 69 n=1 Tax=Pseudoprimorskyibacter insulae TaxID=1695997 RepID=A0A2R8AQB7_9RHOB|nr:aldo/keto reductase [Pseudoprimorskyibacter insulae]SPF78077.1 General stress protein 69 [Pseudoprimorskyibacter insulae]